MGYWNKDNHGKPVIIPSGDITMKNNPYTNQPLPDILGIDNLGNKKIMKSGKDYKFPGTSVLEIPLMQGGGRLVDKSAIASYEKLGYKPIGNNQYVKSGQELSVLGMAAKSNQRGGAEYENWIKSELQKGRTISELVKMGYGTEQGLGILAQDIKPYSDTIRYENPKPAGFEPYQPFDINEGLVKGIRRGDTLFFQPNVPQNLRDFAGLNYTHIQKSIKPENLVLKDKPYFSFKKKGGYKMQQEGFSIEDVYNYFFRDDDKNDDDKNDDEDIPNTAPSTNEIESVKQEQFEAGQREAAKKYEKQLRKQKNKQINDELINSIFAFSGEESTNPYKGTTTQGTSINTNENINLPKAPINLSFDFSGKQLSGKTVAARHNNPGNLKFASWMSQFDAVPGDPGLDGGRFAKFPSVEKAMQARQYLLQNRPLYANKTVDQAMSMYSNKGYAGNIYPEIKNKKMSELTPVEFQELIRRQIIREDTKVAKQLGFMQLGGTYDLDIPTLLELQRRGYKYKFI